ncbi:transglutaminase-like cysteine peptidase [Propionivibrio sp.]|uniref:transglutaminase-like cysteine peptidase n=1 Tax=Propionivibrio sp. TaxID=2212460 RepID=UPI003BF2F50A
MNYDQLRSVNSRFNALPYASEPVDDWKPILFEGDCDSYATAKFNELWKLGWPTSALRLALCWDETGTYHAVLLADLNGQTWVLDNRTAMPTEFSLLPYKWDKLQVAALGNGKMYFSYEMNVPSDAAMTITYHCFECGFDGVRQSESRKLKCECGVVNDFWIDGELPPSNHRFPIAGVWSVVLIRALQAN